MSERQAVLGKILVVNGVSLAPFRLPNFISSKFEKDEACTRVEVRKIHTSTQGTAVAAFLDAGEAYACV